tara:strand:+ start:3709 stop:4863 length:1155 start_codon:yes stop_codon:yes gene_type:complete
MVFRAGFRIFFLLAALLAVVIVPYWVLVISGQGVFLSDYFTPVGWHQHEMIFGFLGAVIAGFLFTAVPNWTGRPVAGATGLSLLALLWFAGRLAVWLADWMPEGVVMIVDVGFLVACAGVILPVLVDSGNKRNYFIPVILLVLAGLNLLSHFQATGRLDWPEQRIFLPAVLLIVLLMNVIGGRIAAAFTRNKYPQIRQSERPYLQPLSGGLILLTALAVLAGAPAAVVGGLAALVFLVTLGRAVGWRGWKVSHDPLLFILHLGYYWLVAGFALLAVALLTETITLSHALHVFTVGAAGSLTLGVMSRASLGHTGQPLKNEVILTAMFVLINLAALSRGVLPLLTPESFLLLMSLSGVFWFVAYGLFLVRFTGDLMRPRQDGKPG